MKFAKTVVVKRKKTKQIFNNRFINKKYHNFNYVPSDEINAKMPTPRTKKINTAIKRII